jgi:hypothetical protein
MLLDSSTVCKPLIERELFFYLNIPQPLISFVPNYKGVVEIAQADSRQIVYNPFKKNRRQLSDSTLHPDDDCDTSHPEPKPTAPHQRLK